MVEAAEGIQTLPIKWWSTRKTYDEAKLKEELIDCLHFLVSAMQIAGMSADDVMKVYETKYAENVRRANDKKY